MLFIGGAVLEGGYLEPASVVLLMLIAALVLGLMPPEPWE
jgi:hypothetical protein